MHLWGVSRTKEIFIYKKVNLANLRTTSRDFSEYQKFLPSVNIKECAQHVYSISNVILTSI